jgi:hypothetical protein
MPASGAKTRLVVIVASEGEEISAAVARAAKTLKNEVMTSKADIFMAKELP